VPWRPSEPGEVPTLGYAVIDWITENLAAPDRGEYEPFVPYLEQEDFILRFYEINPRTGKRRFRRGVLSRPRGWGKSPLLAALCCVEALGPVVPAGWDAAGQPVGMSWDRLRTPLVQVAAVSEQQTGNTWSPLLEMLREGPVIDNYPGLEPLDTFVNLPRGKMEQVTSSARTIKGARPVFGCLDQTEEWVPSNGGRRLATTMRINAGKIGGHTVESPNAFTPGDESVAEESAAYWASILEGRARDDGLYYDHREAPADTDMESRESLTIGLRVAYGDSSNHPDGCLLHKPACAPGHSDIDRLIADIWDPANDAQVSRADFLNQITHATNSWLSGPEWIGCGPIRDEPTTFKTVADSDAIVLGFDGSRKRARGVTDATALIGCRVKDGHVFEIAVWEQPALFDGDAWAIPHVEVDAKIRETFARHNVVGFFADPAKWESYVAKWEAEYGDRLQVKSTRDHPVEWWMTGGSNRKVHESLRSFEDAVLEKQLSHDGSSALTRHVLNARRRASKVGYQVMKEHPESAKKIDAAIAAVLAWAARLEAVAAGLDKVDDSFFVPKRIY